MRMSATGGAGLRFDPETPPESLLLQELRDDTKATRQMVEAQEAANNKLLQALVQEMRAMEMRQLGFPSGLITNDWSTPIAALSTQRVQSSPEFSSATGINASRTAWSSHKPYRDTFSFTAALGGRSDQRFNADTHKACCRRRAACWMCGPRICRCKACGSSA